MIYLTGSIGGDSRRAAYAQHSALGMLVNPYAYRRPWCPKWAADNYVYKAWENWVLGKTNVTPDQWWRAEGEKKWLTMLDKIVLAPHPPLWIVAPDVVGNWAATLERGRCYRHEIEGRGLRVALALQNGCEKDWQEALDFSPFAVFVGGTKAWKWRHAAEIVRVFGSHAWVHIGKVNGERPIRLARKIGADSADGTGLCQFFDNQLPRVLRGLNEESPQKELF